MSTKLRKLLNYLLLISILGLVAVACAPTSEDVASSTDDTEEVSVAVSEGDVVITGDIPLAARVVEKNAITIGTRDELFDDDSIHDRLASRELMEKFRSAGIETGGPKPQATKDVQAFANTFDKVITRLLKA